MKYVKAAGETFQLETEIRLQDDADGSSVTSETHRGRLTLAITARYDREHRLRDAQVTVDHGGQKSAARVTVDNGHARVHRDGQSPAEFDCPAGVIVTSAPDWTDAFLAVRRYDPGGTKTQQFQGLWIHPTQPPQRLVFKVTRLGEVVAARQGEMVRLTRVEIVLRGGSKYIGYKEPGGELVRLAPAGNPRQAILLAGWEQVALPPAP
jgi:hypothetical protein